MGKGDKKSRRGKIHIGSHGVRRPTKKRQVKPVAVEAVVEEPVKKPRAKSAPKPKPAEAAPPAVEAAETVPAVVPGETVAAEAEVKPATKKKAPAKSSAKKADKEDKEEKPAE